MVKVVPTEGSPANAHNSGKDGKEGQVTSNDNDLNNNDVIRVQPPLKDSDAELTLARTETHPANHTTDGACTGEEDQSPGVFPPDDDDVHTTTGIDTDVAPLDPSKSSAERNDLQQVSVPEASGGDWTAAGNVPQLPPSKLDMEKHSGMTTFSLMRQGSDSSLGQTKTPKAGIEDDDDETASGMLADLAEEGDDDADMAKPASAAIARRGTRRFVRQDTGIGIGDGVLGGGGKKKRPFRVPQTMYMGHPLGSPAAEFLERQQHRLAEVKTRREIVAARVGLVMDHNPLATGSGLPDIDEVFPDKKGVGDNSHGDWCV